MSLQNSHLWPLLALALVPVFLYWLERRRARRVEWPAIQFFLGAGRSRIRWLHARDLLVLIARTAAVLALVVAALRPRGDASSLPSGVEADREGIVLAVDTSRSMSYRPPAGGSSRMEAAKKVALGVLARARGDAMVTLVTADGRAPLRRRTDSKPTRESKRAIAAPLDRRAAHEAIESLGAHGPTFDLEAALRRAAEALHHLPTRTRSLYVLSDGTTPDDRADVAVDALAESFARLHPRPRVFFVTLSDTPPSNRWIEAIESGGLAAGTDVDVSILVTVRSIGVSGTADETQPASAGAPAVVTLRDDSGELGRSVATAGSAGDTARFSIRFDAPGVRRLHASVETDGLAGDDVRYAVLDVADRLDVLVVEPERSQDDSYLYRAIWAANDAASSPTTILRPVHARGLEGIDLSRFDAIVLDGFVGRSGNDMELAMERCAAGAGVVVFAGEGEPDGRAPRDTSYDAWSATVGSPLGRSTSVGSYDGTHPALSVFTGPASGDLRGFSIRTARTLEPRGDARVTGELQAGSPWIVETRHGAGRAVVIAHGAEPSASDLPRSALFPPFVHRWIRYVAHRPPPSVELGDRPPIASAGRPARVATDELEWIAPDGSRIADGGAHGPPFTQLGFYTLRGESGEASVTLAANFPVAESRLAPLSEETRTRLFAALDAREISADALLETSGGASSSPGLGDSRRAEYWPAAIVIAAVALLVELALLSLSREQRTVGVRPEGTT